MQIPLAMIGVFWVGIVAFGSGVAALAPFCKGKSSQGLRLRFLRQTEREVTFVHDLILHR